MSISSPKRSISSPKRSSSRTPDSAGKGLSELPARLARSLSSHWKMFGVGLGFAILIDVLVVRMSSHPRW
jgi:hypothetical protein